MSVSPQGLLHFSLCCIRASSWGSVYDWGVYDFPFPETVMTHCRWCAVRPVTTIIFSYVGLFRRTTAQQLNPLRFEKKKNWGGCCQLLVQACWLEVKREEIKFLGQKGAVLKMFVLIRKKYRVYSCLSSVVMRVGWGVTFLLGVVCLLCSVKTQVATFLQIIHWGQVRVYLYFIALTCDGNVVKKKKKA